MKQLVLHCLLVLASTSIAAALDIQVSISPDIGSASDIFELRVDISGTDISEVKTPQFPESTEFVIDHFGKEIRRTAGTGAGITNSFGFTYEVRTKRQLATGTYRLPNGTVQIDGSSRIVKGPSIQISNKPKPKDAGPKDGVHFEQGVSTTTPYVGEQLTYALKVATTVRASNVQFSEVETPGFWRESYGNQAQTEEKQGSLAVYEIREALFPAQEGDITLPARIMEADIPFRRNQRRQRRPDLFDPLFGGFPFGTMSTFGRKRERYIANPIQLSVKPLPPAPGVLQQGYIPVGKLSLAFATDKRAIGVGDSITMTVELYGDANLRPLELEDVKRTETKNLSLYFDKSETKTYVEDGRITFKKKFSIAVVPQKAGKFFLPRFSVVTFDPKKEEYITLTTPEREISVTPSSAQVGKIIRGETPAPKIEPKETEDKELPSLRPALGILSDNAPLSNLRFFTLISSLLLGTLALFYYLKRQSDPVLVLTRTLRARYSKSAITAQLDRYAEEESIEKLPRFLLVALAFSSSIEIDADSEQSFENEALLKKSTILSRLTPSAKVKAEHILRSIDALRFGSARSELQKEEVRKVIDQAKELLRSC